jgi:hypothetical protein
MNRLMMSLGEAVGGEDVVASEINRKQRRCKIDLGKTEREEEVRRAAAARGAPPRGRRKLRIY